MPARSDTHPSPSRVIVIFPGALGDLICLLPTLDAIARRTPRASIHLMARIELARFIVARTVSTGRDSERDAQGHSYADAHPRAHSQAHSIDRREVSTLFSDRPDSDRLAETARFFGAFDRIYSFFACNDARFRAALTASTNAIVSFHRFRPDRETPDENKDECLDDPHLDRHVATAYLRDYLQSVGERGAVLESPEARIVPTRDDLDTAARALTDAGFARSNPILIFPGSGSARKNWPAANFATLATRLAREMPAARVAIILGPAEANLEPIFEHARSDRICLLSNLPLGTVAGLARISSGFVGNDSGVSHLAAAAGAPGVAIFGPTDPSRWRPLGRITVIRGEPIESIEPEEIIAALQRPAPAPSTGSFATARLIPPYPSNRP